MSLSNRIENTIISISTAILTIIATTLIIYFVGIKPLEGQLKQQNLLIKELAMLEKYQIENNFDKLKAHKGQIVLDLENDMTITGDSVLITQPDVEEEKKVGFFKRIFGGKK